MTDARSLHCKEEGVVGKSDVGEGKITSALLGVRYSGRFHTAIIIA